MPIYSRGDADTFEAHGSWFRSYVRSERGASSLCAWRLEVKPDLVGVGHRPTHEEVILMLEGSLRVSLDGAVKTATPGDIIHVPAGVELEVDGGPEGAAAWVTTTVGLEALLAEGERMSPPWAQ